MTTNTLDLFDLKSSICVITGGAGLLGKKHAEAILDGNGTVVLIDINKTTLNKTVNELNDSYPGNVHGYVLDITKEHLVEKTVEKIISEVGHISILINNAANNPHVSEGSESFTRLENFSIESWEQDMAVGVTGAFLMSKYIGTHMATNKNGVILNIASDLSVIAPDQRLYQKDNTEPSEQPVKPVTYSVAKHALIGLTKYLSTYWAKDGVRANAVSFGGVYNGQSDIFVKKVSSLIPLGRMAKPDEYKATILFLCSDASSYINGSNIIADGGRTSW